jgi:hypothetical protein
MTRQSPSEFTYLADFTRLRSPQWLTETADVCTDAARGREGQRGRTCACARARGARGGEELEGQAFAFVGDRSAKGQRSFLSN